MALSRDTVRIFAMAQKAPTYRLTAAGRSAWENEDLAVPEDYRRILWLMDFHGQDGVVGELLHRYPRNVLDEWLAEMEDLGLIEVSPGGQDSGSTFSTREADRTLGLDQARMRREGASASAAWNGASELGLCITPAPSQASSPAPSTRQPTACRS